MNLKRICILLSVLFAWPALAGHVTFNMIDFTDTPLTNRTLTIFPIGAPLTNGAGSIITRDRARVLTGTNGSVTISNVYGGAYRSEFLGTVTWTTNYFQFPVTNGVINASDWATTAINPAQGILAYSQSQNDAQFWRKDVLGPGNNITYRTNNGLVYIDGSAGGSATNAPVSIAGSNVVMTTNGTAPPVYTINAAVSHQEVVNTSNAVYGAATSVATNADNLGTGTLPLARLSGITSNEIAAATDAAYRAAGNASTNYVANTNGLGTNVNLYFGIAGVGNQTNREPYWQFINGLGYDSWQWTIPFLGASASIVTIDAKAPVGNNNILYWGGGAIDAMSIRIRGSGDGNPNPRATISWGDVYFWNWEENYLSSDDYTYRWLYTDHAGSFTFGSSNAVLTHIDGLLVTLTNLSPAGIATNSGSDGQLLSLTGNRLKWIAPAGGGDLLAANNLSDVASTNAARTNINAHNASNLTEGTVPNARLDTQLIEWSGVSTGAVQMVGAAVTAPSVTVTGAAPGSLTLSNADNTVLVASLGTNSLINTNLHVAGDLHATNGFFGALTATTFGGYVLGSAAASNSVSFQPADADLTAWATVATNLVAYLTQLGTAAYSNSATFMPADHTNDAWLGTFTGTAYANLGNSTNLLLGNIISPTNGYGTANIDFSRTNKEVTTNIAANVTLTYSGQNPTNMNLFLIHSLNTSGSDKTYTFPANTFTPDGSLIQYATNGQLTEFMIQCQLGVLTNVLVSRTK